MNILYLLIGVSLFAALIFLWLFVWSVRSGQYDDSYTPSVRILFDDDVPTEPEQEKDILAEKPFEVGNKISNNN